MKDIFVREVIQAYEESFHFECGVLRQFSYPSSLSSNMTILAQTRLQEVFGFFSLEEAHCIDNDQYRGGHRPAHCTEVANSYCYTSGGEDFWGVNLFTNFRPISRLVFGNLLCCGNSTFYDANNKLSFSSLARHQNVFV